jgi:hypothetical protein
LLPLPSSLPDLVCRAKCCIRFGLQRVGLFCFWRLKVEQALNVYQKGNDDAFQNGKAMAPVFGARSVTGIQITRERARY